MLSHGDRGSITSRFGGEPEGSTPLLGREPTPVQCSGKRLGRSPAHKAGSLEGDPDELANFGVSRCVVDELGVDDPIGIAHEAHLSTRHFDLHPLIPKGVVEVGNEVALSWWKVSDPHQATDFGVHSKPFLGSTLCPYIRIIVNIWISLV